MSGKTNTFPKLSIPAGRGTDQLTVGIIGSEGQMGKMLAQRCRCLGLEVIGADPKAPSGKTNVEVVKAANVIILAVPIADIGPIIEELVPHFEPGQLVLDVTSVKAAAVQALAATHPKVELILSHPMCAPNVEWRGQTIVLCPIRCPEWLDFVIEFFRSFGTKVVIVGPRRHDEMMAAVQALPHALLFLFVMTCRSMGLRMTDVLAFATPQFRPLWLCACRILSQNNPDLYFGVQAALGDLAKKNLQQIAQQASRLLNIVDSGDHEAFRDEYRGSQEFVGPDLLDDAADRFTKMTRFLADLESENAFDVVSDKDYPGLLQQVTSVLAQNKVNLTALHSAVIPSETRFRVATEQRRASKEVQSAIRQLRSMCWQVE